MTRARIPILANIGETLATSALIVGAVVAASLHARYLSVPLVDDAAITVAFAESLIRGHGLRLTESSQVVEGFSSPLWTFLIALAGEAHTSARHFAGVGGTVLSMAALPIFAMWGAAGRGRVRLEDAVAPWLAATATTYVYWGASGMETGLMALLIATSGLLFLRELRRGTGWLTGIALGLLCVTRPEGILYAGAAGVVWLAVRRGERRWPGGQEVRIAIAGSLPLVVYLVFRRLYFDQWMPNTYYAKGHLDFHVGAYLVDFVSAYSWLVVLGAGGAAIAVSLGGPPRRQAVLAIALSSAAVGFILRAHGDWMREWRFIAPVVPCLGLCFSAGLSAIRDRMPAVLRSPRATIASHGAVMCLTALAVAAEARAARPRSLAIHDDPMLPAINVENFARQIEGHVESLGIVHPCLAFPDVGGLALRLRDAEIIDTGLLADYSLARSDNRAARGLGNGAAGADYLLNEVLPDYLDVHGPSVYLDKEPYRELKRHYVPLRTVAPTLGFSSHVFVLAGLTREIDPRCPESRSAVQALSAEALAAKIDDELGAGDAVVALALWRCARTWKQEFALPKLAWRRRAADVAEATSLRLAQEGRLESATRFEAFSTVLSGDPARRHRTEDFREKWLDHVP